jgi:hypothetical protein
MAARGKGIKAWVVRWEWAGDHAAVDQPVAAVLRPQTGAHQVMQIVELLHAARQHTPTEMLSMIRRGGHRPYPARLGTVRFDPADGPVNVRWSGEVSCGPNPFLVARLAHRVGG